MLNLCSSFIAFVQFLCCHSAVASWVRNVGLRKPAECVPFRPFCGTQLWAKTLWGNRRITRGHFLVLDSSLMLRHVTFSSGACFGRSAGFHSPTRFVRTMPKERITDGTSFLCAPLGRLVSTLPEKKRWMCSLAPPKYVNPMFSLQLKKKTTMPSSSGQCGLILATEISPLPFFHVRHAKILVRLRALTKHQEEGRRRNVRPFPDS